MRHGFRERKTLSLNNDDDMISHFSLLHNAIVIIFFCNLIVIHAV